MGAIGIVKKYRQLKDVDWPTFADQDVPQWNTADSKFHGVSMGGGGGGGGSFSLGVSSLGNTLGQTGVTGSRIVLAGVGNVTLSQLTDGNGGTISISAGTVAAGGAFSLGAGGGNVVGDTGATGTRVLLAGGNGVTLSQTTDANGATITVNGQTFSQSAQTQDRFDLTLGGNTAGVLQLVSSGTLTLAGGNNVTVSQNGNAVTISGASQTPQSAQTGISSIVASNATYTSGSVQFTGSGIVTIRSSANQRVVVDASQSAQTQNLHNLTLSGNTAGALAQVSSGTLTLAGGNGITLSQAGNAITISGAAGAETQVAISGLAASDTTYSSGTVRVTGVGGGVTVSSNTGQRIDISVAAPVAQTVQTQNVVDVTISGNTAGPGALVSSGTLTLAGGNNITVSQAGNAITISGANIGGAQTGISGIANSQTTYTSGTVSLSDLGAITIRSTTGNQFQLSVAAQTAESQTIGMSNLGNTSGTTGVASAAQVRFLLAGGNNVTLSQSLNGASGTLTISAAAQTNQAGSVYAVGNTTSSSSGSYDARTLSLRGDGIVSIAATNSGFRISASQSAQTQNVHNVTLSGNTAGVMAHISSGTLTLAGGNNVTLSQAGNAVTVSAAAQTVQTQNMVAVTLSGNTSGAQALVSSGTLTLAGGNNITVSQAGNAITISGANVGGAQTGISGLANSQTTFTSGTVSLSELGAITIRSTTGNQFQLSVNAQSVQPETQTFIGGLAASNTTYTSGTVTLTGVGGGITVSSNTGQRIDLSVAAQTNQAGSLFAVGNTTSSSSGSYDARTLSLRGDGIISIAATNSGFRISASQSVQPETQTFIGGISASDTLYTSGSVRFTGVGGGITVSSNTGQRVDLSVAAPVAQTNQSGGAYAVGNTYSSSSGTFDARSISLRGDGIISIAATNSGWRISASQSVQVETQTFVGGLANSQTTYTSGTVSLSELGAITIRSTTGNQFQLSVNAQSVQPETQTFIAGIIGSNTTYTSGSVRFTGVGGGVTVSSNTGQRIDISVAAQSAQTGISSIVASDATYTSGSVQFTGSGIVTIRSSANQRVVIDASQSAQTQNLHNVTLSGNTAGVMAQISSGTMTLAGGANVTLSQAGNAVTISAGGGSSTDTDVSAINQAGHGFSVGDWVRLNGTSYVEAQADSEANAEVVGVVSAVADADNFTLTTGGLVTGLSGLTAGAVYYLSDATPGAITSTEPTADGSISKPVFIARSTTSGYVFNMRGHVIATGDITAFLAGMSNIGNTLGDTGITGSRLVLAGGNNITLSQSTNVSGGTVTISGGAGGGFSAGLSNVGNTVGDTGITGTRLVLAGGNAITLSQSTNASGGTVTISAPTQTTQPGVQHLVVSNTTFSSGTVSLSGFGDVTVNTAANLIRISAPAQTAQTGISGLANSQTTYTSGTVSLSELGAITIRSTTGNQFQLSVNSQTVQTQNIVNVTLSGNTAGAMAHISSGTMTLAGGNNITVSQAGNAVTISGPATAAQTNQSGGVYAVGNTYSSSSGTLDARTLSLRGDGIISIAATNSGFRISASQSVQAETQTFVGGLAASNTTYTSGTVTLTGVGGGVTVSSNTGQRIDISVAAPVAQTTQTQNLHNVTLSGNTAGAMAHISSGTMTLAGGNGITLSQAGNAVTISGGAGGGFSGGVSNVGNTGGATGVTGTRLVLVGSNNVTLSQTTDANGGTVSLFGQSPAGGAFSAGVSNLGNTDGATGITGTQLVWVGSGVMSLSQTTGANGGTVSILAPATSSLVGTSGISISTNGSTISIMQASGSAFLTSMAPYDESPMVTGQQGQATLHLAPVRFPEGVQHDRIALGIQISNATNSSNSISLSQWVGLYTRTGSSISLLASISASTNFTGSGTVGSFSLYGGPKWMTIPWTSTIPEGDYFVGINMRTTTGGGAGHSISQLLLSKFTNSDWKGVIGVATNATDQRLLGQGVYSVSTAGLPNSIAFTQIQGSGSLVLRSPIWHLRSGTV